MIAAWDWYATLAHLANVDPTDKKAASAGLPPIDSINIWSYLNGENSTSPRKELILGSASGYQNTWGYGDGILATVDGLIVDDEKGHLWKVDRLFGSNISK